MKIARMAGAPDRVTPRATYWYTLAHATTPAKELALSGAALDDLIACLDARGLSVAASLRAHDQLRQRSALASEGLRYLWAFGRMRDALLAARANHRSDYHAHPYPRTLREASLDRLFRRFPLTDFPQTTLLLVSGSYVCDDPLLGPDPGPFSLAADLSTLITPREWDRYTLCGFERGAALVSALPSDRWLRISMATFEDTWSAATRQLQAQGATPSARAVERVALDLLLRAQPEETFEYISGARLRAQAHTPTVSAPETQHGDPAHARFQSRAHAGQGA